MKMSKEKLLEYYNRFEPNLFMEYDVHCVRGDQLSAVDQIALDREKVCLDSGLSYELMSVHRTSVKALITVGTSKVTALKFLDEIKNCIKNDNNWQNNGMNELKNLNRLKVTEGVLEKIFEDDYSSEDIEYLLDSERSILDKKKPPQVYECPF